MHSSFVTVATGWLWTHDFPSRNHLSDRYWFSRVGRGLANGIWIYHNNKIIIMVIKEKGWLPPPLLMTTMRTFKRFSLSPLTLSLWTAASVMFGVPLTDLCQRESSVVPFLVRRIVKHIEDVGLDQEGIYRINGNTRIIDKLKMDFNRGENWNTGS